MSSRASKSRGDRRSGMSMWLEALPEGMAWRARSAGRERTRRRLVPELARLERRELLSTFDVTSTADDGSAGTLRQAIAEANAATSPSTIDFQLASTPATITLTQGQLSLNNTNAAITIDGPGADLLSISGNHLSTVMAVYSGVTASLSGLTITGGAPVITPKAGGCTAEAHSRSTTARSQATHPTNLAVGWKLLRHLARGLRPRRSPIARSAAIPPHKMAAGQLIMRAP